MEECGLCIGGGDFDGYWEFFNQSQVKARKPHKCEECYREIAKGQHYLYSSGKWDGDFTSHKMCIDCTNIRDGLQCGGVGFGQLWEDIHYIFPQFNTVCLQKIKTVSAKEYMLERWRKWKGLEK